MQGLLNLRLPDGTSTSISLEMSGESNNKREILVPTSQALNMNSKEFEAKYNLISLGGLNVLNDSSAANSLIEQLKAGFGDVKINLKVLGGKGGFGSMLRAQGGKMSSKKITNFDSCRDLSGRRLATLKAAENISKSLELAENEEKQRKERVKRKIEKGLKGGPASKKVLFDNVEFEKTTKKISKKTQKITKKAFQNQTKLNSNAKKASPKSSQGDSASLVPSLFEDDDNLDVSSDDSENESENSSKDSANNLRDSK